MVGGDKRGKNAAAAGGPEKPSSYILAAMTPGVSSLPVVVNLRRNLDRKRTTKIFAAGE
jgi:hypothetical protein